MTIFTRQLRLAMRKLVRAPLFTGIAVLTLAVGIGANTAIFSVVNAILLEPLPYPESERLVWINFAAPGIGYAEMPFSDGAYLHLRDGQQAFEDIAMYQGEEVNLAGEGAPERVVGGRVTPSFFRVLRVQPTLGRTFTEEEARPGAESVVVLSQELWTRRYGGDPSVVGTTVMMDGEARRIVGIAPANLALPNPETRVWRPFVIDESAVNPGAFCCPGIGRLGEGVSLVAAKADLDRLIQQFSDAFPEELPRAILEQAQFSGVVRPLKERLVREVSQTLWLVLGTVGIVLLIACANVANLFMVRAEGRQRELAVRSAMGASRGQLAGVFLSESLLLGLAGGALGLLIAALGVRALLALAPETLPRMQEIGVTAEVLVFTLAISLLAGLFFGSFPAVRYRPGDLSLALKEGGRSTTIGRARHRARNILVVAQIALALVLLVGSGLLIRSFQHLRNVDPGFEPEGVLTVRIALPRADYSEAARVVSFWRQLRERTAGLPGVLSVGSVNHLPLGTTRSNGSIGIEDHPTADDEIPPLAEQKLTGPGYFETMGIPVLEGRSFEPGDGADGFRAAVVNRSFARHWWPEGSALGRRVRLSEEEDWYEIVGVVGDVRFESLEKPPGDAVYFPLTVGSRESPNVSRSQALVIKTAGDPRRLLEAVRSQVWALDGNLPIAGQRTMSAVVANAMSRTSFTLVMLGIAAAVALLLGTVGIYGVISYMVSQRTKEIGIRIALGAPPASVRRLVLRQGLTLIVLGVIIGLVGALALSGTVRSLLYGVSAIDPLTYVVVPVVLVAVALLATHLPARRASATDPLEALRHE